MNKYGATLHTINTHIINIKISNSQRDGTRRRKRKTEVMLWNGLLKGRIENEWAWFIINNGIPFCNLFYNYRSGNKYYIN